MPSSLAHRRTTLLAVPRSLAALAPLAALVAGLAGCGSHPENDRAVAEATPPPVLPAGVAVDAGTTYSGIYHGEGEACCWLAAEARFETRIPPNAKDLSFRFAVPPNVGYDKDKETVTITVAGTRPVVARNLGPGLHVVDVPVDGAKAPQPYAGVVMHMSRSVVPKDLHINGDVRRLSVALQAVQPR
jgi:hypothetical protein